MTIKPKKPRNQTDSTLRNVRAINKRVAKLEQIIKRLLLALEK